MRRSRRHVLSLGLATLAGAGIRPALARPALPLPPVPPEARDHALPRSRAGALAYRPFVMIDPGHGGSDPGTIGPGGVEEKTITLATGLALRRALMASGRYRVGMTRTTDVFVTLEERVALTMRAHADLFFSLHCNQYHDSAVRGAMVFTLSLVASDAMAATVANAENSFDRAPVDPALRGLRPNVAMILGSLEMRATDLRSRRIAGDMIASFRDHVALIAERPERSANFAVLRDPTTPSTLTEMGFLSNPDDERLLATPSYRALIARRITFAVESYFIRAPRARVASE